MANCNMLLLVTLVVLSSATFCLVAFSTYLLIRDSSYKKDDRSVAAENNRSSIKAQDLKYVTREEWLAQLPANELAPIKLPSSILIIAHTATAGCNTQASCTFTVRFIQTFHMESRNWDDIAYNFMVGGDGAIYEGRGWDKRGDHTKGFNTGSVCIAFVGTFIKTRPTQDQLAAAQLLIEEGVRLGKLSPDYKLIPQNQLIFTESPGKELSKIIKTWPHWTSKLD